ncbi:MAG: inositol monophosphatase, partial [Alphaproteobacteria bacterium]|nr:inositol monophosphatase [Alphaproteobacteria bacterium]
IPIGLEKNKEIVAGVTFDPIRNELFLAEKNKGSFLNGKKIQVSECATLDMAVLGMASFGTLEDLKKFGEFFTKAYIICPNVLTTASTALDLAYVAAGRLDACYSKGGAHPWDVAAGSLLITEAGGIITNHDLQPASIYKNEIVAGNPILFDAFTELTGLH